MIGDIKADRVGGEGLADKLHPRFTRAAPCLAAIAGYAAANHISPNMSPSPMARDDMI